MGRRSTLRQLTPEDIETLHQKIRASWYGDVDDNHQWLISKGYEVTRSALHRYMIRLRETDKQAGIERAAIAGQKVEVKKTRRLLLERLGAIRLEELEIIEKLRSIDEMG